VPGKTSCAVGAPPRMKIAYLIASRLLSICAPAIFIAARLIKEPFSCADFDPQKDLNDHAAQHSKAQRKALVLSVDSELACPRSGTILKQSRSNVRLRLLSPIEH
jgi:hypothetical protein